MSTAPREWPNAAKWARDEAAEAMMEALHALEPLVDERRPVSESEALRRISTAIVKTNRGLRLLESVGAQTRIG